MTTPHTPQHHVLVAYGSRNGSTAEIAEWIGRALRESGLTADVLPAGEAAALDTLDPYDAVLLGSGLYAGRWLREATRFARRHRRALERLPVWLFSSGPLDPSAGERDIPPAPGAARVVTLLGARGHTTFGGRLDQNARGFIARQLVARGRGGDFRDRERVRRWAHSVAGELARTDRTARSI
ncbi:flavodoxin domain-containing protein [Streptomyces sp. DH37]|uniref:flavodoxin domain-containing protein n=1 Tax=Streptomyces sp. DH37 TaxID=3040122 RepID=UPI0024425893|nr:flavodoxin domain-containing protein [Streptomyces sp. DH37]MDG9701621.1 flavodoxin domain-containing protein [Streptomyces sp. DH37]